MFTFHTCSIDIVLWAHCKCQDQANSTDFENIKNALAHCNIYIENPIKHYSMETELEDTSTYLKIKFICSWSLMSGVQSRIMEK